MKKILFFVVAGLAAVSIVSSAVAARMYSENIIYFSDASMSTQVGDEFIGCSGSPQLDGVRTPYRMVISQEPCREGGYECPSNNQLCF
jgi:hypothetical protein